MGILCPTERFAFYKMEVQNTKDRILVGYKSGRHSMGKSKLIIRSFKEKLTVVVFPIYPPPSVKNCRTLSEKNFLTIFLGGKVVEKRGPCPKNLKFDRREGVDWRHKYGKYFLINEKFKIEY